MGIETQFRYSSALVIPQNSSANDPIVQQEITYAFNALRTLASQIDKTTGALSPIASTWSTIDPATSILGNNTNKFYATCVENIGFGAFVNFTNSTPTRAVARCAVANGFQRAAAGFCVTPGGFKIGQIGEFVVGPGVNFGISGLTPGNWYFLDPTSVTGQVTATQPTTPGQIVQLCGIAIQDTRLLVGSLNNWLQL